MVLRCLLFASDEATAQPLWRVITELGMEGEHCRKALEAVESLNNHPFHIVIADWDDEPEASFLLKTARELKAAQRPLTLAIIKDEATVPKALQAGANSVLRKPIVPSQVKDTLGTARDLLRAKLEPASVKPQVPRASAAIAAAAAPALAPRTGFRRAEYVPPAASGLSAQLDPRSEASNSPNSRLEAEVDTVSELEPMAAAVKPAEPPREAPRQLQPKPNWGIDRGSSPTHRGDLQAASGRLHKSDPARSAPNLQEPEKIARPAVARSSAKLRKVLLAAALVLACGGVSLKVPRALWQQNLRLLFAQAVHSGHAWLHPQPAAPPQIAAHENFGQAGDEYKLPVPENIPDATTDPSQIHVLPVVDPTAKPTNGSLGNPGPSQIDPGNTGPKDQEPNGQMQSAPTPSAQVRGEENPAPATQIPADNQPVGVSPGNGSGLSSPLASQPQQLSSNPSNAPAPPLRTPTPPAPQSHPQGHPTSLPAGPGIPRSLQSQSAAMTPAAGGTKPAEAALPSIGPVDLPEAAARALLAQQVEPTYPESARASRQQGTVVLQVLIGRDGAVEDVKFLQGSLAFARAAIDAVKQWHFKPYSFNGRPTVARTTLTLSFKPTS
jgi:TonB family protein